MGSFFELQGLDGSFGYFIDLVFAAAANVCVMADLPTRAAGGFAGGAVLASPLMQVSPAAETFSLALRRGVLLVTRVW